MQTEYYSDKTRLSSSGIKHLLKSPRHYQLYLLNGIEITDAMNHGQFIHTATMEESEIHNRFRLLADPRLEPNKEGKIEFRSALNKSIRDEFINQCELDGVTPIIKKDDWYEIIATAGSVKQSPIYKQLFQDAEVEKEFHWIDPQYNIPMKGKVDLFKTLQGFAVIGDLKKLPDIDIESVKGYVKHKDRLIHCQLAIYSEAIQEVLGLETKFHIVIGCNKESQQNGFFLVPQEPTDGTSVWQDYSISAGKTIYTRGKQIYRDCLDRFGNPWEDNVVWPGVEYFASNEYGLIEL
jgi:hypothetical protein